MPRRPRLLIPYCPHHIVQRGHNRKAVFLSDEDFQFYFENLCEWKQKLGVRVLAWCLMTNHVHLVLEPSEKPAVISELMKRVAGRQAAYVNKLEKRTGSLWEGRFKASPIQRYEYLMACMRYVEMNPVRAGMVAGPRLYRWSSYGERMELVKNRLLDWDDVYLALGDNTEQRAVYYKAYMQAGTSVGELKQIRDAWQHNQLTGNTRFVDEVEQRLGYRVELRGKGRPAELGIGLEAGTDLRSVPQFKGQSALYE